MPTDSLTPPKPPNRVYYSLGRMLGTEDFQAEQDYHRGRLARALLQLCGTGTVSGLKVRIPQFWESSAFYVAGAHVLDPSGNLEMNTGSDGQSGSDQPEWPDTAGDSVADGADIEWTNQGPILASGWRPNAPFNAPSAIVDSNNNVQVLTVSLTTAANPPLWNTATGGTTPDGGMGPSTPGFKAAAWVCAGPADWLSGALPQLEIQVTPGIAIDRAGRIIEVPRTVCIRLQPWLSQQSASDLNNALHDGDILVDVFASFVACTRGVTPCFATQDDYDATDAFSPNRLLDSFAMQLVLRSDSAPALPTDPWLATGSMPPSRGKPSVQSVEQVILDATSGPAAAASEYPVGFDATSVFLARLAIPATTTSPGQAPDFDLMKVTVDNFSRLFLFPGSLVARWAGLSSGAES